MDVSAHRSSRHLMPAPSSMPVVGIPDTSSAMKFEVAPNERIGHVKMSQAEGGEFQDKRVRKLPS